ncbi:MAG: HupE/UreJ family protein [Pseudomonadota bacterium]
MSRIDIMLIDEQQVLITAQLDLTRAFGSADAFFEAAQVSSPMRDAMIITKLATAAQAIELFAGGVRIDLRATDIEFPVVALADFRSPLEWPRATITFAGILPSQSTPTDAGIQVRFTDGFVFEEPLATTIRSLPDGVSKSRWLVTFQRSPVVAAPNWFAVTGLTAGMTRPVDAAPVFVDYFNIGFWHIVPAGIDHLLFVLTLVLAVRLIKSLLIVLSLYTLAHSLSFAIAALGLLPPAMLQVEPLILLSIVVTALLNCRTRSTATHASLLAFGLGLLHGLGFANALAGSGLPTEQRLLSLLGFNMGVEAAQLLWVALLLPIWWSYRYPWFVSRVRRPISMVIALIAIAWLVMHIQG